MRGRGVELPYQAFYCEENVWQACRVLAARADGWRRHAVLVTNPTRTVACWAQRACSSPGEPVVWDYHVVLVERQEKEVSIRDPDCTRGARLPALDWLDATFPVSYVVPARYRPLFRVVPSARYLAGLHTDRRHMRRADGGWVKPPPPWDPPGAPMHDLDAWLDLTNPGPDAVLDLEGFQAFCKP